MLGCKATGEPHASDFCPTNAMRGEGVARSLGQESFASTNRLPAMNYILTKNNLLERERWPYDQSIIICKRRGNKRKQT